MNDRRIRIITGHYGSGKTEFALNYVRKLKKEADRVMLADLDIVNVYFRSREREELLTGEGIEVISSSLRQDSSDMPALSARIRVPFVDKGCQCVVDLGGSEVGASVLGRLRPDMEGEEIDFFMVINIFRPETCDGEAILREKENLERALPFPVTGFVNNTNLIHETRPEDILEGDRILREVSASCGVPVRYTACMCEEVKGWECLPALTAGEFFPMIYHMRAEWL